MTITSVSQNERLHLDDTTRANVEESINRFRARLFLLRQEEARQWLIEVLGNDAEDLLNEDYQQHRRNRSCSSSSDGDTDNVEEDDARHRAMDFVAQLRDGVLLCRLAKTWNDDKNAFRFHNHVVKGLYPS